MNQEMSEQIDKKLISIENDGDKAIGKWYLDCP
jgi:hypothetical protein